MKTLSPVKKSAEANVIAVIDTVTCTPRRSWGLDASWDLESGLRSL